MARPRQKSVGVGVIRRQELKATVTRACRHCGAPGFWHDVKGVNTGCYDPTRKNEPITSDVCPNCNELRDAPEDLGVIWVKEWTVWDLLKDQLKALWRKR